MPTFIEDNDRFEAWLRTQCDVVDKDLKKKHEKMTESAFVFLRATFFRWAGGIEALCRELVNTPKVIAVGDLHAENYGTWRDAEGRLVWGVNDFDEAADIPFAYDLVRLGTSVRLAPDPQIGDHDALDAILEGYRDGLKAPRPTLLDEQETWMRDYVACSEKDRDDFWTEVDGYKPPPGPVPEDVEQGLRRSLPEDAHIERLAVRRKGGGSLGRPRYVAIAGLRGGRVVREAKALVPSAWNWAHDAPQAPIRFDELAKGAFRSPDPFLKTEHRFVFRRVAADSRKVEFSTDAKLELHHRLLKSMGFDIAAIHVASRTPQSLRASLDALDGDWLRKATKTAEDWVKDDFHEWKKSYDPDRQ